MVCKNNNCRKCNKPIYHDKNTIDTILSHPDVSGYHLLNLNWTFIFNFSSGKLSKCKDTLTLIVDNNVIASANRLKWIDCADRKTRHIVNINMVDFIKLWDKNCSGDRGFYNIQPNAVLTTSKNEYLSFIMGIDNCISIEQYGKCKYMLKFKYKQNRIQNYFKDIHCSLNAGTISIDNNS